MISGKTQVVGVIGHPIGHTCSPAMHNAAFAKLGLDWVYAPFAVAPDSLAEAIRGAMALGFRGLNVTIPHKEAALGLADEAGEEARVAGAANTLSFIQGRIKADSTDAYGFRKSLEGVGFDPLGKKAVLLGAGGVARSLLVALAQAKAASVVIANRTYERAIKLKTIAERIGGATQIVAVELGTPGVDTAIAEAELLVNATSHGMAPEADVPLLFDEKVLNRRQLVYDTIYSPRQTRLLEVAREKGCKTLDGAEMLVLQGARSFELWTGQSAPVDVMRKALLQALSEGSNSI